MDHSILCLDDEPDIVQALERLFRRKYHVLCATHPDEGLDLLKANSVSVIISDQRMPHQTGVEFLRRSKEIAPDAIRILLTGYADIESVIEAVNSGEIYRYISKPWDPVDLVNTVDKAVEQFESRIALREKNLELQKLNTELQSLDAAKTRFMMLMNHELKTPLTVILSFCELLRETSPSTEQSQSISRISQAAKRLQQLIDDSMLFLNADLGKISTELKAVVLGGIISSAIAKFRHLSEKKNLSIVLPEQNLVVTADQVLLQETFDRLFHNALKFSDEGSEVRLSWTIENNIVTLRLQNQCSALRGQGGEIKIKPFEQRENIMNHSTGVGLGLALSQVLLRAMRSQLDISISPPHFIASFALALEPFESSKLGHPDI